MPDEVGSLDEIASGLQQLRLVSGNVSYAEIATRIARQRAESGMTGHASKVARTTVYSCFQPGRARINADLVAEIVFALTDDQSVAAAWRVLCLEAHAGQALAVDSVSQPTDAEAVTDKTLAVDPEVAPASRSGVPVKEGRRLVGRPTPQFTVLMMMVGLLANLVPYYFSQQYFADSFPLFFDMIGTAIVAMVLGPLAGVVTATLTVLGAAAIGLPTGAAGVVLALAPVPIAGALLWGFGIHKFGFDRSLTKFILLNVIVGIVCTLIAFTVISIAFDGYAMHGVIQGKVESAVAAGIPRTAALFMANMFVSIVDKLLAGVIALLLAGGILHKHAPTELVSLTKPADNSRQVAREFYRMRPAGVIAANP